MARNGGFAWRVAAALRRRFFDTESSGAEARQKEMGEGSARVRAGLSNLNTEARGKRRTWERGKCADGFSRERENRGRAVGGRGRS